MEQKERFHNALSEYLKKAELVSLLEEDDLVENSEYRNICFMNYYHKEGDETPYRLLVPTAAWLELLKDVGQIFESKVNRKLVHSTIDKAICNLTEFPFGEIVLDRYSNEVFETLWQNYQLQAEALVPLYNIRIDIKKGKIELPLATTVLHSGSSHSQLAKAISHDALKQHNFGVQGNCFLRIQVTGDAESRVMDVEYKSEQALQILRFVTTWVASVQGTNHVKLNPAFKVTTRSTKPKVVIFHTPNEPEKFLELHGDFDLRWLEFHYRSIETAELYGLYDLNFHCNNLENPVSSQIIRSLELYDSGTRALTNWQAMYRYVASVNMAIPTYSSKGDDLRAQLATLIEFGGNYIGTMIADIEVQNPDSITWNELVTRTAEPFKQFYELRGRILHGNRFAEELLTDDVVEDARALAHNAIRLMAHVAREFNWQNAKQAKAWFKSPSHPPSVEKSEKQENLD